MRANQERGGSERLVCENSSVTGIYSGPWARALDALGAELPHVGLEALQHARQLDLLQAVRVHAYDQREGAPGYCTGPGA
jgi:hypothetical protein